jgi:Arylsulfotransferase (ASST)
MVRRALLASSAVVGLAAGVSVAASAAAAPDGSTARASQRAVRIAAADPDIVGTPRMIIHERKPGLAPGYIFTGPKVDGPRPKGTFVGPLISDNRGRPIWFADYPGQTHATDVRVQTYEGQKVLTYWVGHSAPGNPGVGVGTDLILNRHYQVIKRVHSHAREAADQHEFQITRRGTAIVVSYQIRTMNARSEGGARKQKVYDCLVQEVNLHNGKVAFTWHSARHVPLSDSHLPPPKNATTHKPLANTPWDYFHINSVNFDRDGNVIISGRHTWAVYKVDYKTAKTIWTLGGRSSTFKLAHGVKFKWQHNAIPLGHNTYRIFDNNWDRTPPKPNKVSKVLWIKVHPKAKTANLVRKALVHPSGKVLAGSQGNAQTLGKGHVFVGWGDADRISEFNAKGKMLFNAQFPAHPAKGLFINTYRAYRFPWVGAPTGRPSLHRSAPGGRRQFDVVWNGATRVVKWRINGGNSPKKMHLLGTTLWRGLDTAFRLSRAPAYVQVSGVNRGGHVIARSGVVRS